MTAFRLGVKKGVTVKVAISYPQNVTTSYTYQNLAVNLFFCTILRTYYLNTILCYLNIPIWPREMAPMRCQIPPRNRLRLATIKPSRLGEQEE
jgi:hypothetical protein